MCSKFTNSNFSELYLSFDLRTLNCAVDSNIWFILLQIFKFCCFPKRHLAMNKVWNMGLSSSFSFSIVYFLVFFQFVGALWRDYRWKTLLTPEFKSNTFPVVIFGPLTTKPWEFLGVWGLRALFPSGNLPATNGG